MMYKSIWFNGMSGGMYDFFDFVFFPVILWTLVWKGVALWKAAKKEDKAWFVVLMIINTFGILEILYIYLFSKNASKKGKK